MANTADGSQKRQLNTANTAELSVVRLTQFYLLHNYD